MAVTGKLSGSKRISAKAKMVASAAGGDIARQARVEQLRQLTAAGRYRVEPQKLALRILVRALGRHE